jgi:membrane protease YdiL (CAAX protease family)
MTAVASQSERRWGLGEVGIGLVSSLVLSTLIGGVIMGIAGWENTDEIPMWGLGLMQIPLWAGYLGAVALAGSKGGGVVADFGVRFRPLDAPLGLLLGVLAQMAILPILYLPIFELTGTDADELSRPAEELADRAGGTASWLLFALLVGILAPVVEELFYRGLMLRSIEKRSVAPWAAVVISSVVFAAMHLQPLQFPGLLVFGLIAATLAVRTGRLGASIFAHIGFNMSTVVLLYLQAHAPA